MSEVQIIVSDGGTTTADPRPATGFATLSTGNPTLEQIKRLSSSKPLHRPRPAIIQRPARKPVDPTN